jgi:ABC-2 type transport system ATP-binding protein
MLEPGDVALRCTSLRKRYAGLAAVDGLSFEVRRGECFGLLGPNGAGKTTTMEMLEGLTTPDGGSIELLGRSWGRGDDHALRARLGVQLQQTELPDRLTVLEILRLFRSFYPRGPSVDELLARAALHEKRDTWVSGLSGGQKQRLSLACALAGEPELLFLDEPTTGLDPQARLAVWDVVEAFTRRGGTVLVTTHYMDEAARLCGRVAIVDHGRIIALDAPAQLIAKEAPGQVLELRLEPGRISLEALRALPAVTRAEGDAGRVRIASDDVGATLPALVARLSDASERIGNLTTHASTLEDVFVKLTGRALRDG